MYVQINFINSVNNDYLSSTHVYLVLYSYLCYTRDVNITIYTLTRHMLRY